MAVLIDSSVLVAHERGRLDLPGWLEVAAADAPIALSIITLIELYHGLYRATDPLIRARRRAFIDKYRRDWPVPPLEERLAETGGRIRAELQVQGVPIGAHDLLIAVTALTLGFDLATANLREFTRVPGLRVLHWQGSPPPAV